MIDYREKREQKNAELRRNIDKLLYEGGSFIQKKFEHLDISNYRYQINEAVYELCLDEETISELVKDYVVQILKSKAIFYKYIHELKKDRLDERNLDYTDIRNLAHKNLGVARNLRIKDAQKLLEVIMHESNLDYLRLCVKALEIGAVRLNPLCAYETIKLIEVKKSL
jgi:hypothetical protein